MGSHFFGRKTTLEILKRRVLDLKEGYRQNVAFLGNRFVGKTSILEKFTAELEEDSLIVIDIDLDHKDLYYFFAKFIRSLLYNFSKSKNLPLFDDITLLIENAHPFIPQTIEVIKSVQAHLAKEKVDEAYRQLISLPDVFTIESGKYCVIILDEFQDLQGFDILEVFQELGKKIMTQQKCIYIVTSSFPIIAKKILSEKLSLLFGNFEVIEIEPFDSQTSQQFIQYHLNEVHINEQPRNFLADFTGGHPLYLNLIVKELSRLSLLHKQTEVYMPLVTEAIENVILDSWGILSRHFETIVRDLCQGKNNHGMASLLIALANGKNKIKDISDHLGIKSATLNNRINCLLEIGVIVKHGQLFHFQDKLLKYWIQYVFQKRIQSVERPFSKQKERLREDLRRAVNNFQLISEQEFSSRIVELLTCFDNEAFSLNGRKYKLPAFQEIMPISWEDTTKTEFEVIKAVSEEGPWFIVFKKDGLCENDVNTFLAALKKSQEKPQRRIIISLENLDENTRVKALQERMWIWNEKELNALLSFYDKPFIVK